MKKQKFQKGIKAFLQMQVEVKSIDKEAGTLEAIFSTQDVDRHGDVVLQDGWDITMFKKNPVILNSHNYGDAADVIGKASNVRVEAKKLQGVITFAVNENPKAKVIFDLYAGGYLNAFSVGFIPTEFKTNKDGTTDWYTIKAAELLEVSAVSVPANARALAKSKGIDIDALGMNDDEDETEDETDEDVEDDEEDEDDGFVPVITDSKEPDEVPAPEPETKEVPVPAQKPISYNKRVVDAIKHIESREKQVYRKAAGILQTMLDGDVEGARIEKKVRVQIEKRKVNQVIRMLIKNK